MDKLLIYSLTTNMFDFFVGLRTIEVITFRLLTSFVRSEYNSVQELSATCP